MPDAISVGVPLRAGVALVRYAVKFASCVLDFARQVVTSTNHDKLLAVPGLLASALVAVLIVTVALLSWATLVSSLKDHGERESMGWISRVDPSSLKIKLATALVAIPGMNLLQMFLEAKITDERMPGWAPGIHGAFLLAALLLAVADRLEGTPEGRTRPGPPAEDQRPLS